MSGLVASPCVRAVAVAVVWVACIAIAKPLGEFPTNDDWCYSRALHGLSTTGRLTVPPGWGSMTMIAHIAWGALFTEIAGFSHFVLRVSTMIAGYAGLVGVDGLLVLVGAAPPVVFAATLVVATSPLYFHLSNTFMTDVGFVALSTWSAVYFLRALRDRRASSTAVATLLACVASLVRQPGVVLPFAFLCAIAATGRTRRDALLAVAPMAAGIATLALYQLVLVERFGLVDLQGNGPTRNALSSTSQGAVELGLRLLRGTAVATAYVGLFLLPLLPLVLRARIADVRSSRAAIASFVVVVCVFGGLVMFDLKPMPSARNVIYDFGLGVPVLRDRYFLHRPRPLDAPTWVWTIVTAASALGAVVVVDALFQRLRSWSATMRIAPLIAARRMFFALIVVAYTGLVVLAGAYDRYFVFLLPFALALLLDDVPIRAPSAGAIACSLLLAAPLAFFAVAGTRDYFAWNRARWALLDELVEERGVPPTKIDGGFEFNGWHNYAPRSTTGQDGKKSWWWVRDDEYVIAFGKIDGFHEIQRKRVDSALFPGRKIRVLLLKRGAAPTEGQKGTAPATERVPSSRR